MWVEICLPPRFTELNPHCAYACMRQANFIVRMYCCSVLVCCAVLCQSVCKNAVSTTRCSSKPLNLLDQRFASRWNIFATPVLARGLPVSWSLQLARMSTFLRAMMACWPWWEFRLQGGPSIIFLSPNSKVGVVVWLFAVIALVSRCWPREVGSAIMFDHIYRSLYFHQVQNWLEVFPRDQLLVFTNEEFRQNPQVS